MMTVRNVRAAALARTAGPWTWMAALLTLFVLSSSMAVWADDAAVPVTPDTPVATSVVTAAPAVKLPLSSVLPSGTQAFYDLDMGWVWNTTLSIRKQPEVVKHFAAIENATGMSFKEDIE